MKKRYDWKTTINFEVSSVGETKRLTDKEIKEQVVAILKDHLERTKKSKYFKIDRTWKLGKEEHETERRR